MPNPKKTEKRVQPGDRKWKEGYYHFLWQIIRRHPDYRSFCDEYRFAFDQGQIPCLDPLKLDLPGRRVYQEILARFGLEVLYHYSLDLSQEDVISWPSFKRTDAVVNEKRELNPDSFTPKGGRYLTLKIDITRSENEIRNDVLWEIRWTKRKLKMKGTRFHSDKTKDVFRVWDLQIAGKNPSEIFAILWPKEFETLSDKTEVDLEGDFRKRTEEYQKQGLKLLEAFDKARKDVYSDQDDEVDEKDKSGMGKLRMRVRDNLKRMERLFALFDG